MSELPPVLPLMKVSLPGARPGPSLHAGAQADELVTLRARVDELSRLYVRERQRATAAERRAARAEEAEARAWRVTLRGSEVRR